MAKDINVEVDGQMYALPQYVMCAKDSMIASFEKRTKKYECCDCSWELSAKEYIKQHNVKPLEDAENDL